MKIVYSILLIMFCILILNPIINYTDDDNMFQFGYDEGYYGHNRTLYLKCYNYTQSAWGTDNFSSAYMDFADGYVKGYNKWNKTNN